MPPRRTERQSQPTGRLPGKNAKGTKSTTDAIDESKDASTLAQKEAEARQQERANRKRIQNRISQQCVREKHLAQQKQLETMKSILQSSVTGEEVPTAASQKALAQHLELLDENRDLREALLRMRKKFLSLSSATAAIANDKIFDLLLPKKSNRAGSSQKATAGETQGNSDAVLEDMIDERIPEPSPKVVDLDGMVFTPNCSVKVDDEQTGQQGAKTMSIPSREQSAAQYQPKLYDGKTGNASISVPSMNVAPLIVEDFSITDGDMLDWGLFPYIPHSMDQPIEFRPIQPEPEIVPHFLPQVKTSFNTTWRLEEAALVYIARELHLDDVRDDASYVGSDRTRFNALSLRIASQAYGQDFVNQVAKVVLDMMVKASGFSEYIYGIGANEAMEKVLAYRLCPSSDNRAAIPSPFSPTAFQVMSSDHPVAIDWFNWPSIRDQCLFKSHCFDLAQLCADVVANTVIELPEYRAAINIHDTFFTRVFHHAAESGLVG